MARAAVATLTAAPADSVAKPTPDVPNADHPLIATLRAMEQQLAKDKLDAVAAQSFAIAAELRDLEHRVKAKIAAIAKVLDAGPGDRRLPEPPDRELQPPA